MDATSEEAKYIELDEAIERFIGLSVSGSNGQYVVADGFESNMTKIITELYGAGGATLGSIKKMAADIETQIDNPALPWLAASVNIRYSFLFKEDVRFSGGTERLENIRKVSQNHNFMRLAWLERFNYTLCTEGNVFLVENTKTGQFFLKSIKTISDIYVDAEDPSLITHLKTTMKTPEGDTEIIIRRNNCEVSDQAFRKYVKDTAEIVPYYRFFDFHGTRKLDQPLSVPILTRSLLYTSAAARLLADISRYKHSVALFAMRIEAATRQGAMQGAIDLAKAEEAGSFMGFSSDYSISTMGSNGLNIANTGEMPFLAAAAASMTIPVSQYAMSTSNSSGTAGSLVTLDSARDAYYASQQGIAADFFKEILGEDIEITFTSDSQDSQAKNIAGVLSLYQSGLLHQSEARAFALTSYNIVPSSTELPIAPADVTIAPTEATRDTGRDNEADLQGNE